jgi:hypothetical protein
MMRDEGIGERNAEHWGVVAELYKLNVSFVPTNVLSNGADVWKIYSGPSGRFRKHVDTPRGATQFGSLVVCLPYPHQAIWRICQIQLN